MLQNLITDEFAIGWVAMLFVAVSFIIKGITKIMPALKKIFTNLKRWEDVNKTMDQNSAEIKIIEDKLKRDYDSLNAIQRSLDEQHEFITDSLEERRVILNALLCITKGLQEIGANGPTKDAERELTEFINQKAHER